MLFFWYGLLIFLSTALGALLAAVSVVLQATAWLLMQVHGAVYRAAVWLLMWWRK